MKPFRDRLTTPRDELEAVKLQGAQTALFHQVSTLLWDARRALELAGQHSNGVKFTQFEKQVQEAIAKIAAAQKFYYELEKVRKS